MSEVGPRAEAGRWVYVVTAEGSAGASGAAQRTQHHHQGSIVGGWGTAAMERLDESIVWDQCDVCCHGRQLLPRSQTQLFRSFWRESGRLLGSPR